MWDETEKLEAQVMETRKTKLGADHPHTMSSIQNLAFTWKDQNRSIEAMALMRQCVQLRHQALETNHPDLLSFLVTLDKWKTEQADTDIGGKLTGVLLTEECQSTQ